MVWSTLKGSKYIVAIFVFYMQSKNIELRVQQADGRYIHKS
jgi:hypothetical protein